MDTKSSFLLLNSSTYEPLPSSRLDTAQAVKQQQEKQQNGAVTVSFSNAAAAVFAWGTGSASPGMTHHWTKEGLIVHAQRLFMH